MNFYLIPGLEKGPIVLTRIASMVPASLWDTPTGPGRFTLREVAAHMAEWEPIMRGRIEIAAAKPGAILKVYDEEQMAIDGAYHTLDPLEQLQKFTHERAITTALIKALEPSCLKNIVMHPERGEVSAEDLANFLIGHDMYHIEQLLTLV
jgi:DinB superfamily